MQFSDVHLTLCPYNGRCERESRPCHACIKSRILEKSGERILAAETRPRILPLGRGKAAYAGHLFSYWDGDGKAWPTYVVEGNIEGAGRIDVELSALSDIVGAPETRRMFIDFEHAKASCGEIIFENAQEQGFFLRLGLEAVIREDIDSVSRRSRRRIAHLPYSSRAQMRDIARAILQNCPDDVFVVPSRGAGWINRLKGYGRILATNGFDGFVEQMFKMSPVTQ
jgi:hypothetical protein